MMIMKEEDMNEAQRFCNTLHSVLLYAMNKSMEEDWLKDADKSFGYIITDYFETMAEIITDISKLAEYYDDFSIGNNSPLNYAITGELKDLKPHIKGLFKEELEEFKKMIDEELGKEDRGY